MREPREVEERAAYAMRPRRRSRRVPNLDTQAMLGRQCGNPEKSKSASRLRYAPPPAKPTGPQSRHPSEAWSSMRETPEKSKSAPLTLRAPAGEADGSPISTPKRSLVTVLRYLTAQVPSFECVGLIPASGPSLTDASEGCGDCGNGFVPAGKQLDASRKPMTSAYCLGRERTWIRERHILEHSRANVGKRPAVEFRRFKNSVPATAGPAVP